MIRLATTDAGFAAAFTQLVEARREADADVSRDVATILRSVRDEGEAAVRALTLKLDRHDLDQTGWLVDPADCRAAFDALEPGLRVALELA
uniref:histidinol dehydrogenase n=1 Tax=Sphingomonas bacterium TaxID=1895847 RepID=UPI0015754962